MGDHGHDVQPHQAPHMPRLPDAIRAAIVSARAAGLRIVLCTTIGRLHWIEARSRGPLAADVRKALVLAGFVLRAEATDGRSVCWRWTPGIVEGRKPNKEAHHG